MRIWLAVSVVGSGYASGCSTGDEAAGVAAQIPPALTLPYVAADACPGEGCTYGTWLACGPIDVYEAYGAEAPVRRTLAAGDAFEVTTGVVIVDEPGVVVVTRRVERLAVASGGGPLLPNDTIYVLDYLGEGFFNIWHEGAIAEVEVFWPWENMVVGPAFQYAGEVVRPGRSAFWAHGTAPEGTTGWIAVEGSRLAIPNSLDPVELACP